MDAKLLRLSAAALTCWACGTDPVAARDGGAVSDTGSASGADAGPAADATPRGDAGPAPEGTGRAYFTLGDDVFRIDAREGAMPEDVSAALDRLGPGTRDRWITASASGSYLVLSADRGGCGGECLMRVRGDLTGLEAVRPDDSELYAEGTPAISNDGDTIVYPAKGGPHEVDLFLTRRVGGAWSTPVVLTHASSYAYNNMPTLDRDGSRVVFDCGLNPYPEDGANDACEVALDGTGFTRLVGPSTLPGAREDKVQNPHRGLDGLLFEASWPIDGQTPETIWLLPSAGGAPQPIGRTFSNAVSPCPLGDGRFVFLWLSRPGNAAGLHELALAARDGTIITTLTPGVDVADIGLGCSD
jgi:hypothetical protein